MGAIIRNGIDYSGSINASGVFIDVNRVIKANTTFRGSMSYTATEDCVFVSYLLANTDTVIKIDNKWVGGTYASGTVAFPATYFLKKGQTITSTGNHSSYDSSYMVYGVIQGSNVLPDYSTTEHKTGRKWVDGKDLWEVTLVSTNAVTGTSTTIDISSLNADYVKVVDCNLVDNTSGKTYTPLAWYNGNNSYYGYINSVSSSQIIIGYSEQIRINRGNYGYIITIQYTKAS